MESTANPELQISSAQEIKKRSDEKRKGKIVKLPSGLVFRLGSPDLTKMVESGQLPSDLVEIAINSKDGKITEKDKVDNMPKFFGFLKVIVIASVLEPIIVPDNAKENEINYDDLDESDKYFIFNWWRLEGKTLENFREAEQTTDEKSGSSVQKVSEQKTK